MGEDFNQLKMISRRLVRAHFKHPWEFRIEVDGLPTNLKNVRGEVSTFDLLCKEVGYSPITIDTEQIKIGSVTLTVPSGTQPTEITLTMRDLHDGRVRKWLESCSKKIANSDGTFNLPKDYLLTMRRVSLSDESDVEEWLVFPISAGDITMAVDGEGFQEFQPRFIQFRSGA